MKRVIIIGMREKHDRKVLSLIAEWSAKHGRKFDFTEDHYDMTTKPKKGDALTAIRKHKDTAAVVACHLFGMDRKQDCKYGDVNNYDCMDGYMYTKENFKLLGVCISRSIPLFAFGDQPYSVHAKDPVNIKRTFVGVVQRMGNGVEQDIWLYERV